MSHPYSNKARESMKSKAHSMGKGGNLDIPIMRAVGENSSKKLYSSSSGSMQHKDQSAASGYKRGGHVGKPKHKSKIVIAAPAGTATPPQPDPALAAAGAASSPVPAPMPPPGPGQPPMARGGGIKYPIKKGGTDSGVGRLEHSHAIAKAMKK